MSDNKEPSMHIQALHNSLVFTKQDKWGWVIYRTTYKDDAAWERFKQ